MPRFIPDNFQPNQSVYETAQRVGAPVEFVDHELPNFRNYFEDLKDRKIKKGRKESWPMTCGVWMRRAWQGKAGREWEERRHRNQNLAGRGTKPDLFDTMINKINGSACDRQEDAAKKAEGGMDQGTQRFPGRGATAAPINGSSARNHARPIKDSNLTAAAAPMDPLEALKEMRNILKIS